MEKEYTCTCVKCAKKYISTNEFDADIEEVDEDGNKTMTLGDGKCPECLEASQKIAKKVDAEMSQRRRNSVRAPKLPDPAVYFESGN